MINSIIKYIACLLFLIQPALIASQNSETELKSGQLISKEIGPNGSHLYYVNADADKYIYIQLVQNGIDLKINTSLNGEALEEYDSPNFRNGPEPITFTTTETGKYVLNVSSIDDDKTTGTYELKIVSVKNKANTKEDQVDQLFTVWDTPETPGAAVAVVKDGDIIFKKGYGMSNLEYDIPITPSTVFHIASVSKQFTTFSILLLEKDGKLSLDDDIRTYIPEVPDFGKTITLRHLANHTSGLRDQWNLLAIAGWRLDDVITKDHVMKLVERQKDLNFEPGEEYLYCNTGFTLLAEVVARVSNKSFAEFTEERIFKPLNMTSTLFYDDHEKIVKNRAYSYSADANGYKKSVLSYANVGATSLFTTVEDLSLWALNFEKPTVGDVDMMQKMKEPAVLNNGEKTNYALGQSVGKYKGLNRVGHGGADAGYRTYIGRFPDQKFSVIVFSNDGGFNSGGMAHKVVDIYLKDEFSDQEKKEDTSEKSVTTGDNEDAVISIPEETLKAYAGNYEIQPGFNLAITTSDGKLFGQATGQEQLELVPQSQSEFIVQAVQAKISFNREGNGVAESLTLVQGGQNIPAKRLPDFDKDAVDLNEFIGSYYSEELATTYTFIVKDDSLIATHSKHEDIPLIASKKDAFNGNQWFFGQLEFTRNASNIITGCKVTAGRVRNLKFKKIK